MSAVDGSRERAIDVLVDLLQEANRRDIAALERQGWPGIPEVPDYDMRVHCGHLVDALLAAGVFREPQPECGAADRTGVRRCVFTPGHHEVENWTSHADRGGWTWNDQPAEAKVVHSGTGPCDCWACSPEDES